MTEPQKIAARLKELFFDGKWVAFTNYKEQLDQTTWQQAIQRPHGLNSIARLTFHITYYLKGLNDFFDNGALTIKDKHSWDMEEVTKEEDWMQLREDLYKNAQKFIENVSGLSNEDLNKPFIKENYGEYRRNMEGVIEHSYYHFGQIVLLRKIIEHK